MMMVLTLESSRHIVSASNGTRKNPSHSSLVIICMVLSGNLAFSYCSLSHQSSSKTDKSVPTLHIHIISTIIGKLFVRE